MVQVIVGITFALVAAVATLHLVQGARLAVRLGRHVARREPHASLALWLPVFQGPADVARWIAGWRRILATADPVMLAIRDDARLLAIRHLGLMASGETWAVAVAVLLLP